MVLVAFAVGACLAALVYVIRQTLRRRQELAAAIKHLDDHRAWVARIDALYVVWQLNYSGKHLTPEESWDALEELRLGLEAVREQDPPQKNS